MTACRRRILAKLHWIVLTLLTTGCGGGGSDDFGPTNPGLQPGAATTEAPVATPIKPKIVTPAKVAEVQETPVVEDPALESKALETESAPQVTAGITEPAAASPTDESDAPSEDAAGDEADASALLQRELPPTAGSLVQSTDAIAAFASQSTGLVTVFDRFTGEALSSNQAPESSEISTIASNPAGDLVVAGTTEGSIKVFASTDISRFDRYARAMYKAAQQADQGARGHDGRVSCIAISAQATIATGGVDGKVGLWSIETGRFQEPVPVTASSFPAHQAEIVALRFTGEDRLLSMDALGQISSWDLKVQPPSASELNRPDKLIAASAISLNGSRVVIADSEGQIRMISTSDGSPLSDSVASDLESVFLNQPVEKDPTSVIAHPEEVQVQSIAVSDDAQVLLTGCSDGYLRVWSIPARKELERFRNDTEVVDVGFAHAERKHLFVRGVYSLDKAGRLRWWNSNANPLTARSVRIDSVSATDLVLPELKATEPTEEYFTDTSRQELQKLQNRLRLVSSTEDRDTVRAALLKLDTPGEQAISQSSAPSIETSLKTDFRFTSEVRSPSNSLVSMAFSSDGTQLTAGRTQLTSEGRVSSSVYFWDLPTGTELRSWNDLPASLRSLQPAGAGRTILTLPTMLDLNTRTGVFEPFSRHAVSAARSPDGKFVAIGSRGKERELGPVVRVFDARTLTEVAAYDSYESYPTAMTFGAAGNILVVGIRERKSHKLVMLDAKTLELKQLIEEAEHSDGWLTEGRISGTRAITDVMLTDDGRTMLTHGQYALDQFRVSVWKLKNEKWLEEERSRAESKTSLMQSGAGTKASFLDQRGTRLALRSTTGFNVLNLDTRRREREIEFTSGQSIVSPDGRLLAVGTEQGKIQVWQLNKDKDMVEFPAHLGPVVGLCFSPDGQRLATAGEENAIHVWNIGGWIDQPRRVARN